MQHRINNILNKTLNKEIKRERSYKQAVPVWYELEKHAITELYKERDNWCKYGVDAHVDHIVPLQHKLVCGLHTLANLRVITAYDNLSKHNKFEV